MTPRASLIFYSVVGVVFVLVAWRMLAPGTRAPSTTLVNAVYYVCEDGRTITAAYYQREVLPPVRYDAPPDPNGSVVLALSDGRTLTLSQTLSADGVRYSAENDPLIFWSKGNAALLFERGKPDPHVRCIAAAPLPMGEDLGHVYGNPVQGFSIRLPGTIGDSGFTAHEAYRYSGLGPGKEISGVKFTIPAATAKGTNLGTDSYVSVEKIPDAGECTANLFLNGVPSNTLTEDGMTYSVASSTGAAAGNRYEETVYALFGASPCYAVRYFVHYGIFENYPPGTVRPFDAQALLAEFDAIRRTLVLAP